MDEEKVLKEEEQDKVSGGRAHVHPQPKALDVTDIRLTDKLASGLASSHLAEDKLAKVSGGSDSEDEVWLCPCGGTFHVLCDYGRSICYECNKCGKTLVQGR